MDRHRLRLSMRLHRVPRTRGDGPLCRSSRAVGSRCSPHTRGWTGKLAQAGADVNVFPAHAGMDRHRDHANSAADVFPAHAGMDRNLLVGGGSCLSVPRTRGDGPLPPAPPWQSSRCSPHTRGWTANCPAPRRHCHVFPAHAGMDRRDIRRIAGLAGVPRTRGDGPWPIPSPKRWICVFPAHAGMDRLAALQIRRPLGVPRTRGDGPKYGIALPKWLAVFPAHAGMDRPSFPRETPPRRVPRTRGDGPS